MCIDKFWLKLSILTFISTVITNEFLIYTLKELSWPVANNHDNNVTKLLLVADPQIQGLYNEPQGILGDIFRLDSDNYLRNTYNGALRRTEPHAVLFLGDLIDEGSEARTEELFDEYVSRFNSIYDLGNDHGPAVFFVPGDNDIGGEGNDPITDVKLERFHRKFSNKGSSKFKRKHLVKIVLIDGLTNQVWPQFGYNINKDVEVKEDEEQMWRVGITHFPLHMNNPEFSKFVRDRLRPDLVLSGHLHFGLRILRHRDSWRVANKSYTKRFAMHNEETIQFNLHETKRRNELVELVVPTCSYRMGMPEMAFGLLHFNGESGEVVYNNLWLPQRFFWLKIYGYSCGLIAVMLIVGFIKEQRIFCRLAAFLLCKEKNKKQS